MNVKLFPLRHIARAALAISALLFVGCGSENSPNKSSDKSSETDKKPNDTDEQDVAAIKSQIKDALPAAAGAPNEEFELLARSSTAPSIANTDNHPLSLVVLVLRMDQLDESPEKLQAEVKFLSDGYPKTSKIAEAMVVSRRKGYVSVIQPDYIDDLTCEVDGTTARGHVTFTIKECFRATVQYVAVKKDGAWRISEFSLPVHETKTVLGDNGKWTASGPGVATVLGVRLPLVDGLPPREDSPARMVIHLGRNWNGVAEQYEAAVGQQSASIKLFATLLAPAVKQFTNQRNIATKDVVCVLRVDRDVPVGLVQEIIKDAAEAGIEQFRLPAIIRDAGDEPSGPYPHVGEFALATPLARPGDNEELELIENLEMNDSIELDVAPATVGPNDMDGLLDPIEAMPLDELNAPSSGIELTPANADLKFLLPPLRLRLQASPDGSLVNARIEETSFGADSKTWSELRRRLMSIVGEPGSELAEELLVEIDADYELRYQHWMEAISACSGYRTESGAWVPLVKRIVLAPPRTLE